METYYQAAVKLAKTEVSNTVKDAPFCDSLLKCHDFIATKKNTGLVTRAEKVILIDNKDLMDFLVDRRNSRLGQLGSQQAKKEENVKNLTNVLKKIDTLNQTIAIRSAQNS